MEIQKWNTVLVDWINCLKLTRPIQNLEELKDGIFFSNLQKVIKKSSEVENDVLTSIFHIFHKHYPDFVITNESIVHLNDLTSCDLTHLTSLLLHYTCIYDQRDALTSPLCYNLKQVTQVCIRKFLEKVQECKNITKEVLQAVIENCVGEIDNKLQVHGEQWSTNNVSILAQNSPLQDIFKTPAKSSRLIQKEKGLIKLTLELEQVQDEKDILEEDLRQQMEKNKKLEKHLNQKVTEISRLKSEIVALENRTPPHFKNKNWSETERLLKTKIDSLEQIIKQCDKENDQLQEEKDAAKAQVKMLEAQCKIWLEKFIKTDESLQSLSEHSQEQETKFRNLQSHCDELELLLEETRSHKSQAAFEDSIQVFNNLKRRSGNYDPSYSHEDLAHSVIDVQLKELQKENDNLLVLSKTLEDELKKKIEELDSLNVNHEKLTKEIMEITDQRDLLKNNLDYAENNSKEFKMEVEKLSQEKAVFEYLIIQKDCVLEEFKLDKGNLLKTLEDVKLEKDNLNVALAAFTKESTEKLEKMSLEKDKLLKQCNSTENNLKEVKTEFENLLQNHTNLKTDIKRKKIILKELKLEKENLLNDFEKLKKEKDNLTIQFVNFTEDSAKKIDKLTLEREELKNQLNFVENNLETIKNVVEKLIQEKNNLKCIINQKDISLKEFEMEKDSFIQDFKNLKEEKDNLATKLVNFTEESTEKIQKLNEEKEDLIKLCSNAENNLEMLKNNVERLSQEKTDLESVLLQNQSVSEECKLEKENLLKDYEFLLKEKDNLTIKLNAMIEESTEKLEKLAADKENFSQRNSVLETVLKQRDTDLEILELMNEEYLKDNKYLNQEKDNMIKEKESLLKKCIDAENILTTFKLEVDKLQEEKTAFKAAINQKDIVLKELRTEKENLLEDFEKLKQDRDELTKELDEKLEKITLEKVNLLRQLCHAENISESLKKDRDKLLEDKALLEAALNQKDLDIFNEQKSYKGLFEQLEQQKQEILKNAANITSENKCLEKQCELAQSNLETFKNEVEKLKEEKCLLETTINQKQAEIEKLIDDNNNSTEEAGKENEILTQKCKYAEKNLEKLVAKIQQLLKEKSSLEAAIKQKENDFHKLNQEKNECNKKAGKKIGKNYFAKRKISGKLTICRK